MRQFQATALSGEEKLDQIAQGKRDLHPDFAGHRPKKEVHLEIAVKGELAHHT
jgi:hypothetical protein